MAITKIFTQSNYFVMDVTGENFVRRDSKSNVTVREIETDVFEIRSELLGVQEIALSEIQDEGGTPYNAATWQTFYTENTGFESGGALAGDVAALQVQVAALEIKGIINVPTEESTDIDSNENYVIDASGGSISLTVDTANVEFFSITDAGATFTDTNTVTLDFGTDQLLLKLVNASVALLIVKDPGGSIYNVYNSGGGLLQTLTI